MIQKLQQLQKVVNALMKLIPTIIDVIEDLADDGKLNDSK
jgi:hypothetical protein